MPLTTGVLFAFLIVAQAQAPRSPVRAAISSAATAQTLPELIRGLDADGRVEALAGLDSLERAALDAGGLAELSEAYRLLGRPTDALTAARALSERDVNGAAGDAQAIMALAQAGDYSAAQAAAESGLKRFPGDKDLLALLHQVKGRSVAPPPRPSDEIKPPPARKLAEPVSASIPVQPSGRRAQSRFGVPEPPLEAVGLEYVPPSARKRTLFEKIIGKARVLYQIAVPGQDADDHSNMERIRTAVDRSSTGRKIVAELGGWAEIEKTVDLRMANLPKGTGGLAIPLNGYRHKLFISRTMKAQPDAVAASVLVHELSHIADFKRGDGLGGLAIPSEFSAHRVQVRAFLELKRGMSERERKEVAGDYGWEYSNFIAELWEDHILARYPDKSSYKKRFGNRSVAVMAGHAYEDLATALAAPGSAQLDYHLTAPDRGVYTMLTDEKDILAVVRSKKARGVEPSIGDAALLKRRGTLMRRVDKDDAEYRRLHGFELGEVR